MTVDEFVSWIVERHPDLSQMGEEEIRSSFGKYDGESLEKIKAAIVAEYNYKTAPSVAKIRELIKGISLKKTREGNDQNYAYLCSSCGTLYRGKIHFFDAYKCPICGDRMNNHSLVKNPNGNIVYVQTICVGSWDIYVKGKGDMEEDPNGTCPWLSASYQDNTGPGCELFGNYGSILKCQECLCRSCCESFTREREEMMP